MILELMGADLVDVTQAQRTVWSITLARQSGREIPCVWLALAALFDMMLSNGIVYGGATCDFIFDMMVTNGIIYGVNQLNNSL